MLSDGIFETAGSVDDVQRTIRIQAKMPNVTGASDMTAKKATVHNSSASNARAECEQQDIGGAFGSAEPGFGKQGGLAVVEDGNRLMDTEPFLPVEIFEAMQASRHGRDGVAVTSGQTGRCGTDASMGG